VLIVIAGCTKLRERAAVLHSPQPITGKETPTDVFRFQKPKAKIEIFRADFSESIECGLTIFLRI
jgi:hypothetical protein